MRFFIGRAQFNRAGEVFDRAGNVVLLEQRAAEVVEGFGTGRIEAQRRLIVLDFLIEFLEPAGGDAEVVSRANVLRPLGDGVVPNRVFAAAVIEIPSQGWSIGICRLRRLGSEGGRRAGA